MSGDKAGNRLANSAIPGGRVAVNTRIQSQIIACDKTRPTTPAGIARTVLSVSNWHIKRVRDAPRESRMPNSRCRDIARASIMLATLALPSKRTREKATRIGAKAKVLLEFHGLNVAADVSRL